MSDEQDTLARLQAAAGSTPSPEGTAPNITPPPQLGDTPPASPAAEEAPPAPAAEEAPPAAPVETADYWVIEAGQKDPKAATASAVQDLVNRGVCGPVCKKGTQEWKKASDFGFTPASAPADTQQQALVTTTGSGGAVAAQATNRELPAAVVDEDEAARVLAALVGGSDTGRTLADAAEAANAFMGMSHSLPFVQLRKGNWETPKQNDIANIEEFMPAGSRAWTGIYVCHRVGATGWIGAGDAGKSGSPPAWRFVIPHYTAHPQGSEAALSQATAMLEEARKCQYTKADDRAKFDSVGRCTPEVHILMWHPRTQFILLTASGFRTVEASLANLKSSQAELNPLRPFAIQVDTEETINKKVMQENPNARNAKWTEYVLKVSLADGDKGQALMAEVQATMKRDPVAFANVIKLFKTGQDFEGLSLDEALNKLALLSQIG